MGYPLRDGEKPIPELPDPFAPLPVCPPGMLQGDDGLPLTESPPGYPLDIQWDGILVDDEDHSADVVERTRQVIDLLWGERADAIEREACEISGCQVTARLLPQIRQGRLLGRSRQALQQVTPQSADLLAAAVEQEELRAVAVLSPAG